MNQNQTEIFHFQGTVFMPVRRWSDTRPPTMLVDHATKGRIVVDLGPNITTETERQLVTGAQIDLYGEPTGRQNSRKQDIFKASDITIVVPNGPVEQHEWDDSPPAQVASDEPCCSIPAQNRLNGSPTGWHSGPCMED